MKTITNEAISQMIQDTINVCFTDILPTARSLLATLLMSHDVECKRLQITHKDDKLIDVILNSIPQFRNDEALFRGYAENGFFAEQLEIMLKAAKKDLLAGRRLMPVFCNALTDADRYKIPDALQQRIIKHIKKQRKVDGFAITSLEPGNIEVVPAEGVTIT